MSVVPVEGDGYDRFLEKQLFFVEHFHQRFHGILMALLSSFLEPADRLNNVLFDAFATIIAETESKLCFGKPLIGGFAKPLHGLNTVLFDGLTMIIADPKFELCLCNALCQEKQSGV